MQCLVYCVFFFQAEDGIRDVAVTGVQTCALPISIDTANSSDVVPGGKSTVCRNAPRGDKSRTDSQRFLPFISSRILAAGICRVTQTPICAFLPETLRLTAAFKLAFCTEPISRMGYQYWLNAFVSHGDKNEKSGWLSVKTPAISSM